MADSPYGYGGMGSSNIARDTRSQAIPLRRMEEEVMVVVPNASSVDEEVIVVVLLACWIVLH